LFHCKLGQNERDGGRTVTAIPSSAGDALIATSEGEVEKKGDDDG